jgi:hypothetical protein
MNKYLIVKVYRQVLYLRNRGRVDDAFALYQEWKEHFREMKLKIFQ